MADLNGSVVGPVIVAAGREGVDAGFWP